MPAAGSSFRGRTVLVTGASAGIGRDTALAFARAGARLVLVARRPQALAAVARGVRAAGAEALVATADVAKPAEVAAAFRKAERRYGGVDIVVNNAGHGLPAALRSG